MTDPLDTEETRVFHAPPGLREQATPPPVPQLPTSLSPAPVAEAHGGARPALSILPSQHEPGAERPRHLPPPPPVPALPKPAPPVGMPSVVPTQSPLFRHEALRAYGQGLGIAAPLDVAPLASRVLFFVLLAIAASGLTLASLGHVELTSLGRGVMRAPEGVQPVTSSISGVVSEVLVEAGATVAPGQVLLRIDSSQVRAQLLDAERKLAAMRARHTDEAAQTERLHRSSTNKLRKRRALIERRIHSQQRGVRRLSQRAERVRMLNEEGLSDQGAEEDASEALDGAERASLALEDQLALADVELSRLDREYEAARALRREELERTSSERDSVRILLEQTEIRAARHGKLEGLRVTPGEAVQPGSALARVVPSGTPVRVIAFMPERDRAFLTEGRAVRLELDRLPVGEFGSLAAHVQRISNDVAAPEELALHLGEPQAGAYFRVDLALDDQKGRAALEQYLQSGTLVTVRAPLRSRRILSLMFDPIRHFLD